MSSYSVSNPFSTIHSYAYTLQEKFSAACHYPEYQLLHIMDMSLSYRKKLKNLFRKGKHDDRSTLEGAGPHSDEDAQGEGQPEAPMAIKVRKFH